MKRKTLLSIIATLCVVLSVVSCSPDDDDPKPGNGNNPGNNGTDSVALFVDKLWTINKVYKNGVDKSTDPAYSWMVGASYSITKNNLYSFNIPGYPSAGGTWQFAPGGKSRVNFETGQGPGFKWVILALNKTNMTVEEPKSDGSIMKFEFSN